jgi:hypothetical protein
MGGVDFVQDGDLGVHGWIGRKRILFETLNRRFHKRGVAAHFSDRLSP